MSILFAFFVSSRCTTDWPRWQDALRARWGDVHGRSELDDLAAQVDAGDSDPYAAAETLLAEL